MIKIFINNKEYQVKEAKTEEELKQGLKGVESLNENEGMLFYMSSENPQEIFTMKGCKIPLDIIYINQDLEVIDVKSCKPKNLNVINDINDEEDVIAYVLELNINSGIKIGDELEFEEDAPVMKVLGPNGETLMELWGGERIFRRAFTKQLIRLVKQADSVKNDEEQYNRICKRIGKKMFKEIKAQDNRPAEYVQSPT